MATLEISEIIYRAFLQRTADSAHISNSGTTTIDRESCSINETGPVGRQKDNRFRNFVRGTRPACWRFAQLIAQGPRPSRLSLPCVLVQGSRH